MHVHNDVPARGSTATNLRFVVLRVMFVHDFVAAEQIFRHVCERQSEIEGLHGRVVSQFAEHVASELGARVWWKISQLDLNHRLVVDHRVRRQDGDLLALFLDLIVLFLGLVFWLHLCLDDDHRGWIVDVGELHMNLRHRKAQVDRVIEGDVRATLA